MVTPQLGRVYYVSDGAVTSERPVGVKEVPSIATLAAAVISSSGKNLAIADLLAIKREYEQRFTYVDRLWLVGGWLVGWRLIGGLIQKMRQAVASDLRPDLDKIIEWKMRQVLADITTSFNAFERAHVMQILPEASGQDLEYLRGLITSQGQLLPETIIQAEALTKKIKPLAAEAIAYEKQRSATKIALTQLIKAADQFTNLSITAPEKLDDFKQLCTKFKKGLANNFAALSMRGLMPMTISIAPLIQHYKALERLENGKTEV